MEIPISPKEVEHRFMTCMEISQNWQTVRFSNFLIEGADVPTFMERFAALFPRPNSHYEFNFLGTPLPLDEHEALYRQILAHSLPESALKYEKELEHMGVSTSEELFIPGWEHSGIRQGLVQKGWPMTYLAFGTQRDTGKQSITLFTPVGLPPSFAWRQMQERIARRLEAMTIRKN